MKFLHNRINCNANTPLETFKQLEIILQIFASVFILTEQGKGKGKAIPVTGHGGP
jgi:hypothetical protein